MLRIGLVQLNGTDDPCENLKSTSAYIRDAAKNGAEFILTPEVTNLISFDRSHQNKHLRTEKDDLSLSKYCVLAEELCVWLSIGSLAIKSADAHDKFVNRSFLISPKGEITARYDKIHMFDATISKTEIYSESDGYAAGDRAVVANTPFAKIGMSICYDVRFPKLYRDLAKADAQILTVPCAFTVPTGKAHLETLLRSRAIETGSFVIAACQTGDHKISVGRPRSTFGHSMVIDPWGTVLVDAGVSPGVSLVDIDLEMSGRARKAIPALANDGNYAILKT